MKKLYFLDKEEKNRVLSLHESATKRQYLTETPIGDFKDKLPSETIKKFTAMNRTWESGGTDVDGNDGMLSILKTFTTDDFKKYNEYLSLSKKNNSKQYSSFQNMINGEMEKDNMDDVVNITNQLKKIGINANYTKLNINDFLPNSFKIGGTAKTNTVIPNWATCAKQFGGTMEAHSDPNWVLIPVKSDKVGSSIWFKNTNNVSYRPGGGAQDIKGTWACTGGKLTIKLDDKSTWNGKWIDPNNSAVVDPNKVAVVDSKKEYQQRAKQVNQQTINTTIEIQKLLGQTQTGNLDALYVERLIDLLKQ